MSQINNVKPQFFSYVIFISLFLTWHVLSDVVAVAKAFPIFKRSKKVHRCTHAFAFRFFPPLCERYKRENFSTHALCVSPKTKSIVYIASLCLALMALQKKKGREREKRNKSDKDWIAPRGRCARVIYGLRDERRMKDWMCDALILFGAYKYKSPRM